MADQVPRSVKRKAPKAKGRTPASGRCNWTTEQLNVMANYAVEEFKKGMYEKPTKIAFFTRMKNSSTLLSILTEQQVRTGYGNRLMKPYHETKNWIDKTGVGVCESDPDNFEGVVRAKFPQYYILNEIMGESAGALLIRDSEDLDRSFNPVFDIDNEYDEYQPPIANTEDDIGGQSSSNAENAEARNINQIPVVITEAPITKKRFKNSHDALAESFAKRDELAATHGIEKIKLMREQMDNQTRLELEKLEKQKELELAKISAQSTADQDRIKMEHGFEMEKLNAQREILALQIQKANLDLELRRTSAQ